MSTSGPRQAGEERSGASLARYALGLSAWYHDSAAALLRDGEIVAAAQEERFTRRKGDDAFPAQAVASCLAAGGITMADVELVAFYEKPLLKFDRLIDTYLAFAPRGLGSFATAMPLWTREKLFQRSLIRRGLATVPGGDAAGALRVVFAEHHQAHAASAFFPSPFERAAVLCIDGVGERATTTAWRGEGRSLTPLWSISFPHSLGLLYSAFTQYLGFKVNSDEYKVMGLAPYGEPRFVDRILGHLLHLKDDGTFRLDMRYFDFATGLTMTNRAFHSLLGGPPRQPEGPITQQDKDLARSVQAVTEEIMLRLARTLRRETGERSLCLAGGVALNCVANGRVLREAGFDGIWIQPAAGDAGGALGAALAAWHEYLRQPRSPTSDDAMQGALLGPDYSAAQVDEALAGFGAVAHACDEGELLNRTATLLAEGGVVGWFQGRMEFGPRALGARSILADPRDPAMQSRLNLKIKFRESFRPFAPAVTEERAAAVFELDIASPYMQLVAQVRSGMPPLPAVTHVNGSARLQTVGAARHPRFHALLEAFERRTGCPVLVNTSFNVRGEPVVCTPADAYRCFMKTGMDHLVLGDRLLHKAEQPPLREPAVPRPTRRPGARGWLAWQLRPLHPLWRAWLALGHALGWFQSRVIFGAAWLALVLPYAAVFRLLGRSPLDLGFDEAAKTYRTPAHPATPDAMERPY
jgi:carbamoyltransferase